MNDKGEDILLFSNVSRRIDQMHLIILKLDIDDMTKSLFEIQLNIPRACLKKYQFTNANHYLDEIDKEIKHFKKGEN